ncbi:uncharacterized protein HMPREF1541_03202 [Cyphellophora europaea CBS 101466]|uniref:Glycoside hydrolase family 5 domain-containing protein n=1 Tax=Cyphellophora europaea (strain CBS 101466) TaxID=1220924 RepID=W2RXU6_CYPE1|nr:uncharacterized protein HMPREF1541_03202 [Cyphellophora europaea CBS 101466]ETN41267.1 hypothetical protein HMPREF1541_03202 [Cyphellophora europaea CBS 101466]
MARRAQILGAAVLSIFASIYLAFQILLSANHEPASLPGYAHPQTIQMLYTASLQNSTVRPPLRAQGRYMVDSVGTRIKLTSINWYGASDELFVVGGLNVRHRDDIARTIAALGFNSVRLPYSDQLVIEDPIIPSALLSANPDLIGFSAVDVYSAVVTSLTSAGILVIPNNHITTARWCCDANLCDGIWHNDYLGPLCKVPLSKATWIDHLETIMRPHVTNPLVIGVDLRNEIRAVKDGFIWKEWAAAAEEAAERLHLINPEWLMFIEGVSSANILSGARKRPVTLSTPDKVVYSAHVYGWSGWGTLRPYWNRDYASFAKDMQKHWGWLLDEDVAPVWIGEFGAPSEANGPNKGDLRYWRHLVRYLREVDADWGYWALNPRKPRQDAMEGYGILDDDWESVRWDYRLADLGSLMAARDMLDL